MTTVRLPLRVVFYYEADRWVAHCLEFDLLGDGVSKEEALECLWEAIKLQIEASLQLDEPDNLFTPAEGRFFHMFGKGKHIAVAELHVHIDGFEVERVEAREYEASNAGHECGLV